MICRAFEEVGIRSFVSDFSADYTCMEVLQGASIPMLQSIEGRKWRQQYESGATKELSEEAWLARTYGIDRRSDLYPGGDNPFHDR